MATQATCPECDERFELPLLDRGKGLRCPACGTKVPLPPGANLSPPPLPASPARTKKRKKRRRRDEAGCAESSGEDSPINVIAGIVALALAIGSIYCIVSGVRWLIGDADKPPADVTADPGPVAPVEPAAPARVNVPPAPFEIDPLLEKPDRPVYLADMSEFAVAMGPWKFGKGELGDGRKTPIKVGGVAYPSGLGVHANDRSSTRVCYALGGKATELVGAAGLNETAESFEQPGVSFAVIGDGRELWNSGPLRKGDGAVAFRVDVSGVKVLELRATNAGSHFGMHAVWLDPAVEK